MDEAIADFVLPKQIRFSRYADDMTFSGDGDVGEVIRFVRSELGRWGLKLNARKTRVMGRGTAQEVTGIVVNERLRAPRHIRRQLRQVAHYIERFGFDDHVRAIEERRGHYAEHMLGKATFALFIDPHDRDATRAREVLLRYLSQLEQ